MPDSPRARLEALRNWPACRLERGRGLLAQELGGRRLTAGAERDLEDTRKRCAEEEAATQGGGRRGKYEVRRGGQMTAREKEEMLNGLGRF